MGKMDRVYVEVYFEVYHQSALFLICLSAHLIWQYPEKYMSQTPNRTTDLRITGEQLNTIT